ncbi:MAG: type II/IV secretion system protein [Deltaproteobacteria bacterium]|nr:type II/IV secretion system protein [Deltaproteobacteria bacterium]
MTRPIFLAQAGEQLERLAKQVPTSVLGIPVERTVLMAAGAAIAVVVALGVLMLLSRGARGALRKIDEAVNRDLPSGLDTLTVGRRKMSISQLPMVTERLRAITTARAVDIVKLVDYTVQNAIALSASDIHFDPKDRYIALQYRIDGALYDVAQFSTKLYSNVLTRVKVLAKLKTFVKGLPQDGRIHTVRDNGEEVDLRVSVMPTLHGEKIVLRVMQREGVLYQLTDLGFDSKVLEDYLRLISMPQGIAFLTGPTGSGKTTTIYSTLKTVKENRGELVKIVTIEDPIEFDLDFLTQTGVNEATDFTFARGLRSILRQDPDVIMVGEIRDLETAQIAIQAGLSGHLLFTSVHANSASAVFSRLINLGVEPFLLASATVGVLSQRLVRRLCPACVTETKPTEQEMRSLERTGLAIPSGPYYMGAGCEQCLGKGYVGRLGLFELVTMTEPLREALVAKATATNIELIAREQGMHTLLEDGISKCQRQITSLGEVMRVALV